MRTQFAFWLTLLLLCSSARALKSSDFSVEADRKLDSSGQWSLWTLKYKGQRIGELHSIGGPPQILDPEAVSGPAGRKLFLLRYYAGSAGTSTLIEWERLLVLASSALNDKESPQVALDIPLGLRRFQGRRSIESEQRKLQWNHDHSSLRVGPLDEYRETRYVWREGHFVNEAGGN